MRAAWYESSGAAHDVLVVGEMADPVPGPGEVLVRIGLSGVNPGDTKKRRGWTGTPLPYPRVVPHSDGAGVVAAVGPGVDPARVGRRVWVHSAQSYRAHGTAAELTSVPDDLAVDLPDDVSDEVGACLGIPGITAHRAVLGDGPVEGTVVLVQGVLGAVGSVAAQLASRGGAHVIGTVRSTAQMGQVHPTVAGDVVALDDHPAERIRALAPGGVHRVVEVSFSDNIDLDAQVLRQGGVLAAYSTRTERPALPFWPMLFDNVTIRLLGSDGFPVEARTGAVRDLTRAAAHLRVPVAARLSLGSIADAHDLVDTGPPGRVLLDTRLPADRHP